MKTGKSSRARSKPAFYALVCLTFLATVLWLSQAAAFTLKVVGVDKNGTETELTDYRWLVEEDRTYQTNPGVSDPGTLALDFHASHMPVVANGDSAIQTPGAASLSVDTNYFVSVLPNNGFSIGGAPFKTDASGNAVVTVYVNKHPIPTAQITIFVFHDNNPVNNAPDQPEEEGLGGFALQLEDGGGRYGISAGRQIQDAFGNFLGTTYQFNDLNNNGVHDKGEPFVIGEDGMPVVAREGSGVILTGACPGPECGLATIKYLAPGKYGIMAVPPAGEGWQQTSTIEGTKVIDAWVKADEPPFFAEFGPPGFHVTIGFVKRFNTIPAPTGVSANITGQVVNSHLSRPPETAFHSGAKFPHTTPWVALNAAGGLGPGLFVARTNDGAFEIPNVPPGDYQLAVFDDNMDIVFAFHGITVNADGSCSTATGGCDFGDVPVFNWFTGLWNYVFYDANENGIWDNGEFPLQQQNINLRWRDGTIYQAAVTNSEGFAPFDQAFPFFSWLVAEVDFASRKATGVTVVADAGGAINSDDPLSFGGQLNPQEQHCTGYDIINKDDAECFNKDDGDLRNLDYPKQRTEVGPVLTQAFQGFLGQTSVLQWGKSSYGPGENGGISGMVFYATTRAENDARFALAEVWEPGIPRVTVNLYRDSDGDGIIDDLNGSGGPDAGDMLSTTQTDSWDDNQPKGCPGNTLDPFYDANEDGITGDCYDGMRVWNQVRPGVFDGGYAFTTSFVDAFGKPVPPGTADSVEAPLPVGIYIVEVVPPTGYKIQKEEDKNVDFGDEYTPSMQLTKPACVGEPHLVPAQLSLFPGVPAPFAGQTRPLCDRKKVLLSGGANVAADFFLFTEVPIAGHIIGFILDDTANEFDPNSPQFGEKFAPPWLPVSIRDWTGREISRTYSDQWGRYNALVPSTFTANLPQPSGMSPNMITACMNDGTLPDGTPDPHHNPQYSTFCYTFQYMPGTTTYLDTPVVPIAAFAGPDQFPLDCELPMDTPKIKMVSAPNNGSGGGPYVPVADGKQSLTIDSMGTVLVPNPAYAGPDGDESRLTPRNYGFGDQQGSVTVNGVPVTITGWTDAQITATVPRGVTTGELVVTRSNGKSSVNGVTLQVGLRRGSTIRTVAAGGSIQAAIDAAGNNDLILVGPGTYNEMVIMHKPVQLQGWGAGSCTINAVKTPPEKLLAWRQKVEQLVTGGLVDLLPGQANTFAGIEPAALFTEEGAGIFVIASQDGKSIFALDKNRGARIDGLTITGADTGGGIVVNGYADYLEISNNVIKSNSGFFGGGIRVGHPELMANDVYVDAMNDNIRIHNNFITQNGGQGGAGGGVSVCTGTDNYQLTANFICGNFNLADGGGIGHLGLSDNGLISKNQIFFNESFFQGRTVHGGGIFIGGQAPLLAGTLSPGSGSIKVIGNLIQGNLAGAGDGGAIRTSRVNGQDVANSSNHRKWYRIELYNNMMVNNVSALAGGGISLFDTVKSSIIHNTVAHNDSTATAGEAFTPGNPNQSNPQPAGIVSRAHSTELNDVLSNLRRSVPDSFKLGFSNPELVNNIVYENRSFYFFGDLTQSPPLYELRPYTEIPDFRDLAVLGTVGRLNPDYCLLTSLTGFDGADYADGTNRAGNPGFIAGYFNGGRGTTVRPGEPGTGIQVPAAFDEGGNFIQVRFGPLTLNEGSSDYHIGAASAALDVGLSLIRNYPETATDFDGQPRRGKVDMGADER